MLRNNRIISVAVGAAVLVAASSFGAVAAKLVTSDDIKNQTIRKADIGKGAVGGSELRDGSLKVKDLSTAARKKLQGDTGPAGPRGAQGPEGPKGEPGVANLESDGPYPGETNLTQGDNSTAFWTNSGLNRSWVMCAPGKVALGGGFTLAADASDADKRATQVVTSQPVQIVDGNPDAYTPIAGDPDGSYVPNGWLVEGYYTGNTANLVVRPHVVCANVD